MYVCCVVPARVMLIDQVDKDLRSALRSVCTLCTLQCDILSISLGANVAFVSASLFSSAFHSLLLIVEMQFSLKWRIL